MHLNVAWHIRVEVSLHQSLALHPLGSVHILPLQCGKVINILDIPKNGTGYHIQKLSTATAEPFPGLTGIIPAEQEKKSLNSAIHPAARPIVTSRSMQNGKMAIGCE